jgi:hypothetical protein
MPLINNWRRSYRLYSIQISLVIALAILLFVARLVKQGSDEQALR